MIYRLIMSLMIITTSFLAYSKEVVSLGDTKNSAEFSSFLKSNPQLISYNDFTIKLEINKNYKLVKSKYDLAFDGLLKEDLSFSIILFKEIIALRKTHIFSKNIKPYISKSYLNLARLDKENQKIWIKKSASFNPFYLPDSELFNPEIINLFNQEARKTKSQFLPKRIVKNKFLNEDKVFINGFEDNFFVDPNEKYYVTIYREGFKPLSRNGFFETFKFTFNDDFLINHHGTCSNPEFKKPVTKVFFNTHCIKNRSNQRIASIKNFQQNPLEAHNSLINKIDLSVKKPKKSFFKKRSTWIVIGTSILASSAAILINEQNNKNKSFQPVHTVTSQ